MLSWDEIEHARQVADHPPECDRCGVALTDDDLISIEACLCTDCLGSEASKGRWLSLDRTQVWMSEELFNALGNLWWTGHSLDEIPDNAKDIIKLSKEIEEEDA